MRAMNDREFRNYVWHHTLIVLVAVVVAVLVGFGYSAVHGAEKPIDPVVALAWAQPLPTQPAKPVVASGCGCQSGATCGASFCKANGGGGCPQSCPVKAANPIPAAPLQTYTLPGATYGGCSGGSCPAQSRPVLFPRLRGW